jgi:dTDP-4-amino-4,6-dideoxygalactose transaminase
MDPTRLEAAVTTSTHAVIPVHIYGHPADMDPIAEVARTHGLIVLEDAAQAHGAEYRGRRAGSLGQAGAFSFYPAKNLGACGEAGAVTTDDQKLARTVRMLRDHGQAEKNRHEIEGYNGRLDAIQAAILRIKMRHLEAWNERRRELAALYREHLSSIRDLVVPQEASWARSVHHLYVVRTPRRDELREALLHAGISTGLHYPRPLHFHKAYASLGRGAGSFPASEGAAAQLLSLPMYPELEPESVEYICNRIQAILR